MPDPDLEIGEGGGEGRGDLQKQFFLALWTSVWSRENDSRHKDSLS